MAYDTSKLYYNPSSTQVTTSKVADNAFELSADQRNGLSSDYMNSLSTNGSISYSLPDYAAKQTGTGLANAGTAAAVQNNSTNSPYQPSAGTGNVPGYTNNTIAPQPPQPNPAATPYANGLAPDDPSNKFNTATGQLNDKYKQTLATLQKGGTPAPNTPGSASAAVQSATPPPPPAQPNMGAINTALSSNPGITSVMDMFKDYFNPVNQATTLTEDYTKMVADSGLPAINTQLMNMKNVIDGTENDIRREVQAAGGFATDSQVQALAIGRNKSLIKNYNNLLETKNQITDQVNTMMGLDEKDRAAAQQQMEQQLGIATKLLDYQEKFTNNAREGYSNVIKAVGYSGLYNSLLADPSSIPLVERTLGLQPGQLQQLATAPIQVSEEDQLNLENKKLQNAKLVKELNSPTKATDRQTQVVDIDGKKVLIDSNTGEQVKDLGGGTTVGGVDDRTMTKIQSSPEYKTINGVLPALQALKSYKDSIEKYGGAELFSGAGRGELSGTYGNAIAAWKTLAGLGALSGADFALAENAVPSTGFFQRNSTMKAKLDASIKNAITQAETLTTRLIRNYPQAKDNLQRQLDEAKVIAYPEKYKVVGDEIYEITNN